MYKVMLVDDDYPTLEVLSEMIDWEVLGLELQSMHENGANALEHALTDMPDILITDIGMPKMDGIELTKRLKEEKSNLQVSILSCHNEFEYAQKALKLNVQDYILKETLDPEDLTETLRVYKERLDNDYSRDMEYIKLQDQAGKNRHLSKEKFLRELVCHPHSHADTKWYFSDNFSGFKLAKQPYTPVFCVIDNYLLESKTFATEDTLRFAVQNVVTEVLEEQQGADHFNFEGHSSVILFPAVNPIKKKSEDIVTKVLLKIQSALRNYLKVSLSFIIGTTTSPQTLQSELILLAQSKHQRFYMKPSQIQERRKDHNLQVKDDLFSYYNKAAMDLRKLVFEKDKQEIEPVIVKWMAFIEERVYPPEIVKEWVLKLLLEVNMKMKALQYFQSSYNLEITHQEIFYIQSLDELKTWLIYYLRSAMKIKNEELGKSSHKEVFDACLYVSMNLERKLSLDEVAKHLYLNPSYFSRLFKQKMGKTFVEYVKEMKMERAKELLDQTAEPVGKISARLGYDNQSYFIKLFKKHVGRTPIEFRGNHN